MGHHQNMHLLNEEIMNTLTKLANPENWLEFACYVLSSMIEKIVNNV